MKKEKTKKNLGIIKKNCVTKKEVRVGNAKIKSHCTYGKSTCWSSGNAISPLLSHPPGPEFQPFASPSFATTVPFSAGSRHPDPAVELIR